MYYPNATYRIQFHRDFTFSDFERIIPYLDDLGIQAIYASPIFSALPGSNHGYDGIDSNAINPEIGTLEQFKKIAQRLKSLNIGWIQDFVPNHMAYDLKNPKIMDLLLHGQNSLYWNFFDISKDEPIMFPILGSTLKQNIEDQNLILIYHQGKFFLNYFNQLIPVNYSSLKVLTEFSPLFAQICNKYSIQLEQADTPAKYRAISDELQRDLATNFTEQDAQECVDRINKDKETLINIHAQQHYRLCHWQETNKRINYRRFFSINGLIAVNIDLEEVFDEYHTLLFDLIDEGIIQGIRIDHIDGLLDPEAYLHRLRSRVGDKIYIVVEKILEANEQLPTWPVQGTTGYDFLAQVNNLLTNANGKKSLENFFFALPSKDGQAVYLPHEMKRLILEQNMKGEWHNLTNVALEILRPIDAQLSAPLLHSLIGSLLCNFPVYRYYVTVYNLCKIEKTLLPTLRQEQYASIAPAFQKVLLPNNTQPQAAVIHFWKKFMQLSGPLTAKGIEDTLMYRTNAYMGNNEVGDHPYSKGMSVIEFHRNMTQRNNRWSLTMNTTATHDTKRGEDARARLQALSHLSDEWIKLVNAILTDHDAPINFSERYAIAQTIIATVNDFDDKTYKTRLAAYLQKAAREDKRFTNWDEPNEQYEQVLIDYAYMLVDYIKNNDTWIAFINKIKKLAVCNTAVQLILKLSCPGVADIYQGTEYVDYSFVDPDNRRKVNYNSRLKSLKQMRTGREQSQLSENDNKQFITYKLLQTRKNYPGLFQHGVYLPVKCISDNAIAFVRQFKDEFLLVVLPLGEENFTEPIQVEVPTELPENWTNLLTEKSMVLREEVKPGVYFCKRTEKPKKSGILLPLSSLPAPNGIGDLGKDAYAFARSLARSGQRIWQMLPLNPVSSQENFSPYAVSSAFAADAMYIDLQDLCDQELLWQEEILHCNWPTDSKINYVKAKELKLGLLTLAFNRFKKKKNQYYFEQFCKEQAYWLHEYCLYATFKQRNNDKPWYQWSTQIANSSHEIKLNDVEQEQYVFEQWKQFIFQSQWDRLRKYCNALSIVLVGDVPFYLPVDSADVWSHPSLFKIDPKGNIDGIAGVPPDYFSATGQLWGMPTYNWSNHKETSYRWWINRISRNTFLFDIVRLDHFRAFYNFWEVPKGATNASVGSWKDGPKSSLMDIIKQHFPNMPFIVEDLGEIHPAVYKFKADYNLPGMRIFQFGFNNYDPTLRDLPHNYNSIDYAYTGTHDNDTLRSWYENLKKSEKIWLLEYFGKPLSKNKMLDTIIITLQQSVAPTVIFPLQDIQHLPSSARINTPGTTANNWVWRSRRNRLTKEEEQKLLNITRRYNRI